MTRSCGTSSSARSASGEFDMNQERMVADGVRRIRQRALRKKTDLVSAEIAETGKGRGGSRPVAGAARGEDASGQRARKTEDGGGRGLKTKVTANKKRTASPKADSAHKAAGAAHGAAASGHGGNHGAKSSGSGHGASRPRQSPRRPCGQGPRRPAQGRSGIQEAARVRQGQEERQLRRGQRFPSRCHRPLGPHRGGDHPPGEAQHQARGRGDHPRDRGREAGQGPQEAHLQRQGILGRRPHPPLPARDRQGEPAHRRAGGGALQGHGGPGRTSSRASSRTRASSCGSSSAWACAPPPRATRGR